jgi:hypothetical protein
MKKNIFASVLSLATVLFFFTSCDKDDDPAPKTKTEMISTGSWKFSSATVAGFDVSSQVQACQKDNIITFTAAGLTGTLDEGLTKCNGGDPQTQNFTWSFGAGETTLNISTTLFSGGSGVFTVVSLTETQLVLSQQITIGGNPQTAVVTFVH